MEQIKTDFGIDLKNDPETLKNNFRYPEGEAYDDLVQRLDPFVQQLLRTRDPVIIIAHVSIVR